MEISKCLICGREAENDVKIFKYDDDNRRYYSIECPFCGIYNFAKTWRGYNYLSDLEPNLIIKLKFCLKMNELDFSNNITKEQFEQKINETGEFNLKMPKQFSQYQIGVFGYQPPKFNNEQDIQNYINNRKDYSETTNEKLDKILIYFYEHNGIDGNYIDIPEKDYSLLCIDNSKVLNRYASNLKDSGLLEAFLVENDLDMACLSVRGQIYVEDLLNKNYENSKLTLKSGKDINNGLINETKHLLHNFPKAEKLFNDALEKYTSGIYERNLLDDMRLALELFLKNILNNNKSLENQKSAIGIFQKEHNASPELSNMFIKLVDYYAKYHNSNIKHNDNIKKNEIGFLVNLTSSFIMYFNV
jgi:hypothetical protein